jgi:hypothetical protein
MIRHSGKPLRRLLLDGSVFRLHPAAPVPCQIGQVFLAGGSVNQADDIGPHDATPLLTGADCIEGMFPVGFATSGKWFRGRDAVFQFRFECRPSCAINLMVPGGVTRVRGAPQMVVNWRWDPLRPNRGNGGIPAAGVEPSGSIDDAGLYKQRQGYHGRMTPLRAKPIAIAGDDQHVVRTAGR